MESSNLLSPRETLYNFGLGFSMNIMPGMNTGMTQAMGMGLGMGMMPQAFGGMGGLGMLGLMNFFGGGEDFMVSRK